MGEIKQIRLCGLGGQGIVLGGTILGHAGINDGKWVAGSNSYGAEARGSACRAEVIISDEPIIFPHVTKPDILIAMSQEAYDKYIKDMGRDIEKNVPERFKALNLRAAELGLELGRAEK